MRVAIITRYEVIKGEKKHFYINKVFINLFEKLNITPIPIVSAKNLENIVDVCDALLIPGNRVDIDPKYYNETEIDEHTNLAEYNDFELDKPVIEAFNAKNKKILGICAGLQSINVCFGGSLYQHIENHDLDCKTHNIKIEKKSSIYKIYNKEEMQVNSFHHQALKNVADGFKVIAMSSDGIIEAIEKDNILGVQWHPEMMNDIEFFKKYFEVLNILK